MLDFILNSYLWIKALHVISFICWMAALLYLPRLFVYHTKIPQNSESYQIFLTMERKLIRIIMTPSMLCTFLSGTLLLLTQEIAVWMHIKGLAIILLAGVHGLFIRYYKSFHTHQNKHSERFFRIVNEAPSLLMIIIVFTVIFKP